MRESAEVFDELYRGSADPWGTSRRWYEERKRALLMASLPRARYRSAYEAACGTGHISVELARRCDALLASDGSAVALEIARTAVAGAANVHLARQVLPDEWPEGSFDLIVLGELLYFLEETARLKIARLARWSAGAEGLIVACDWRAAIEGFGHDGDDVHRRFGRTLDLPKAFEYVDDDFILTGWSADTTTVAMREGLR